MTTAKTTGPAMLSRVSSPYLRALGELHVCELRLRRIAREGGMGPSWHEATDFLLQQSEALQERLTEGPLVEHALHVRAVDGSMVPADIVFVQRLVRRMSYQLGLVTVEVPTTTGQLPTAPVSTISPEAAASARPAAAIAS
jgi:hypothetical protein